MLVYGVGAPLAATGLLAATVLTATGQADLAIRGMGLSAIIFVVFAAITLDRQRRRERPRLDVTLLYWRSAMLAAMLAALVWLTGGRAEVTGVLLLIGVGVGLPSGMLFKIMPFLSWFHLQHRQVAMRRFSVRLPHMQSFIPETQARIQFGVYLVALMLLAAAAAWPGIGLTRPGGLALILSSLLQGWLLLQCWRGFQRVGQRLD